MNMRYAGIRYACAAALLLALGACEEAPQFHDSSAAQASVQRAPVVQDKLSEPVIATTPASGATVTKTVRVGLLLPLTGRNASMGRAMQDAATVALFDKYARLAPQQASTRVELLPKDTGDTPEQAQAAMKKALDDGAQLIIGPVFSDATQSAASIATAKSVSVISFSNNNALAAPGVYPFGFSPQEQTARIVRYALHAGKTRIAALVPSNGLGDTVLATAQETLAATGNTLVSEVKYAPAGVGIDRALSVLVPPGTTPNFDALLLPEGGPALGTILRAMAVRGIRLPEVQLLGTGIWDDSTLIRRVNLEGAWLASSPPQYTSLFEQRFASTYKYAPPRVASLAYDAVALAVTLATSGRNFDTAALTNSGGFSGPANGIFRLRHDGSVERSLAVLQVNGAGLTVIDPAPTGFTTPAARP